jgi:hypothetical protein
MAEKKLITDISQFLVFPFQDEAWVKKFTIASMLIFISFIPVIPVVRLLGYLAEIIRRIAVDQEPPSLPEWDDLGRFFEDGFRLFGAGALYMIPSTLFILVGYACLFIPAFFTEVGGMGDEEGIILMLAGNLAGFGLMGIGTLLSMIAGVILPVAGSHVAVKRDFAAAFKFAEIRNILKANWSGFLIAFLILIGGSTVLFYGSYFLVLTVILCCLYPFALSIMAAYLALVGSALIADAYRIGVINLPVKKDV